MDQYRFEAFGLRGHRRSVVQRFGGMEITPQGYLAFDVDLSIP